MITCSMPEATASSTAYWITGLSTRGNISFGWALVAGRKRVPHPAAGKTAFRTRMKPRPLRGVRSAEDTIGPRLGRPARRRNQVRDPGADAPRLVEVGQVGRPTDQRTPWVGSDLGERPLGRPEEEVVLAVDQQRRTGVRRQARLEPFPDQRADGDGPAGEREAGGGDRVGNG